MPLAALLLLAAAQAPAPPVPHQDIIVTGHGGVPFISPMGEPIRARRPNEDTLARWFSQVDLNRDGFITSDEMVADAVRYFTEVLDTNHDGVIDPDELVHYEWTIAPEIQVNSRFRHARAPGEAPPKEDAKSDGGDEGSGGDRPRRPRGSENFNDYGPQGAARYALLNLPEPVAAADADFNRVITLEEFKQAARERFQLLDKAHQGRLTLAELEAMLPKVPPPGAKAKHKRDEADTRIGAPLPKPDAN